MPGMPASTVCTIASANARPTLRSSGSLTVTRQIAVASSCVAGSGLFGVDDLALDEREVVGPVGAGIPERRLGERCLLVDVEARERHGERVAVAAEFVHRDLQRRRRRLARRAGHPHPIAFDLLDLDRVEAGGHVGAEVLGSADLVEQLRCHGLDVDHTAGAVVLADHARAVGGHLGPREPEPGARPPTSLRPSISWKNE